MSRETLQIPRAGEVQRRKWMWAGVTSLPVSHCTLFSVLVAKQQNASRPLAEANNQNLITKAIRWLVLTLSHLESSMRESRKTWWPWCCPSWFCKGLPGWAAPWDAFAGRSLWREGGDTLTFPSTGMTVNPKVQDCATNCGGWLQHHRSCGGLWDWQEICNQEDSVPFHRRPKCCFAGGSQCILLLCFQTQVPYFFLVFFLGKTAPISSGGAGDKEAVPPEHSEGSGSKYKGPGGYPPQPHKWGSHSLPALPGGAQFLSICSDIILNFRGVSKTN